MPEQQNYSDPVQEIMGTIPSWIIRCGVTVIAVVFVLILIGCCIVKYPQTIKSTISIDRTNPRIILEATHAGIIDMISVNDGQVVKQGDLIALLRTSAMYDDVLLLKDFADTARNSTLLEIVENPIFKKTLKLGSIQDKWMDIYIIVEEYLLHHDNGQEERKRSLLAEQIIINKKYYNELRRQRIMMEEENKLQMHSMRKDSVLCQEGLIPQFEYEASKQKYLAKLNDLLSFDEILISAHLNTLASEQMLYDWEYQLILDENEFCIRFYRAISELISQIENWFDTYAIVAPFDGIVFTKDFCSVGQFVRTGDVLASVDSFINSEIKGRMKVTSEGFGRIDIGQEVNVRLKGFPYMEFGIIKGVVSKISYIPEKLSNGSVVYSVEISFPNGLVSTYGKVLPFIQDMDGDAEIITRDQRLIEHLVAPLISLIYNH